MSDALEKSSRRIRDTLDAIESGDRRAATELLPILYDELRKLARALMRQRKPGETLQATALVHEAYLRLAGGKTRKWDGRGHFFAAAARAMKNILVDEARRKRTKRRGGDHHRVNANAEDLAVTGPSSDILALDEALERLEQKDEQQARIVLLRFFAGFEMEEIAAALGVSKSSVERKWRLAKEWLSIELDGQLEA